MGGQNCKSFSPTCASRQDRTIATTSADSDSVDAVEETFATDIIEEVVCKDSALQENRMQQFELGDDGKILLVKQDGIIYALGAKCSHYGARLVSGALGNGRVRCPWHGACFSLSTGDLEDFPGCDSIHTFKVTVDGGNVKVRAKRSDLLEMRRVKPMEKLNPLNSQTFVIIGGGPSGAMCAETLRQEGFTGRIVVVCRENFLPYDRVKLSKQTHVDIDKILLRSQEFYDEHNIEMMTGVSAEKVIPSEKMIILSNGEELKYIKLYLATGSRPTMLPLEGMELTNCMVLRDTEHAQKLMPLINSNNDIVILGGGFISVELASYAANKVNKVTVVMRKAAPFQSIFGEEVGIRMMQFCKEQGIDFIPNSGILRCEGHDGVLTNVVLSDGTSIKANVFLLAVGTVPNTEFLSDSGIKLNAEDAVIVDRFLKTSAENVYAGGDIAYAPVYSNFNLPSVIGHYPLAQYHGKVAALNMVGKHTPCKSIPFFWSMVFGKSIRYTGYGKWKSFQIAGSLQDLSFIVYYFDEQGRVNSMMSLNKDPLVAQYAEWLVNGKHLYKHDLEEDPFGWTTLRVD